MMNFYLENRSSLGAHRYPLLFALFLFCFILPCCAVSKRPLPEAQPALEWHKKTPNEILDRLRHDQDKITSLTAAFSLSLDPPPRGQPSNLRGVLFFARGPRGPLVRIKGLGPFGRILFDMVLRGDELQIYIPSKRTLYRGRAEKEDEKGNIWEDTLTAMFADFSSAAVPQNAALSIQNDRVILPLKRGEIWIDRKTALVLQVRREGKVTIYDDYEHKPGLPPIPTRIEVRSEDESQRSLCRLNQLCLNCDTTDIFDLSGYKPRFVRDLKKLDSGHP